VRPTAEIRRHLLLQRLYERVLRLGDQRTTSMSNNGGGQFMPWLALAFGTVLVIGATRKLLYGSTRS